MLTKSEIEVEQIFNDFKVVCIQDAVCVVKQGTLDF